MLIGAVAAIIATALVFFAYYKVETSSILSFTTVMKMLVKGGVSVKLSALTLLPSLLLFGLCYWRKQTGVAQGVVAGAVVVVLLELAYYFLG
jgi:hypothetical protein